MDQLLDDAITRMEEVHEELRAERVERVKFTGGEKRYLEPEYNRVSIKECKEMTPDFSVIVVHIFKNNNLI